MVNVAVLMGRLTADPELRHTANGIPVTSFSIAVDRRFRTGEERQTDFINIVAWRQSAEFVANYFKKGQLIAVEGSIQTRRYQDKDGNNRTAFEVIANNVHFAEPKRDNSSYQPQADQVSAPVSFDNTDDGDFTKLDSDDDLPF